MNNDVSYFICKQCYKYKYSNDELPYRKLCFPLYFLNCKFSGYDLCVDCYQKYASDELIETNFIEKENKKEQIIIERKIEDKIKQGRRMIVDIPKEGDLINIKLELGFSDNYDILKEDFEYTIFDSVELIINYIPINKIHYYDIYKHDKVNKKIVTKDLENKKVIIELPFSFCENSPLCCKNIDINDVIQLRFEFGCRYDIKDENKSKIEWINPKIVYTYLTPGHISQDKMLEISGITQYQTDGEQQLPQNIKNDSDTYNQFSYTLNYRHPVTEINFGLYYKSDKKYLDFLDCIMDVQIWFNGCDLYPHRIAGDSIKKNGNIYTIKFEHPINMSFIENVKLMGRFKTGAFKNIVLSDVCVWISADSYNKIMYNSNLIGHCKYISYCCCGGYNIKIFDDRKKVENVNIFDDTNLVFI
jgi:hypothetical protein